MDILLFDMDGVLLEAHGYVRALQETVRLTAAALGFDDLKLHESQIDALYAAGFSSEWDAAALVAAWLQIAAWERDAAAPDAPRRVRRPADPPSLDPLIQVLPSIRSDGSPPVENALRYLLAAAPWLDEQQQTAIRSLLQHARDLQRSATMRLFQELALGSDVFARTYGLPPQLAVDGYLATFDRPALDDRASARLLDWLAVPDHHAAVMTNRPGRWPDDAQGSPEAEAGLRLLGLESLPVIHWGALEWLGARLNVDPQTLCKPAPLHALAALRCALGDSPSPALQAAVDLLAGRPDAAWAALHGAQVTVFEDSENGLRSLLRAADLLARHGLHITPRLIGIAETALRRDVLATTGATCYPALSAALAAVL